MIKITLTENGITLHAKTSALKDKLIGARTDLETKQSYFSEFKFYVRYSSFQYVDRSTYYQNRLIKNGCPNFTFLMDFDLERGVTYNFKGVYTLSDVNLYVRTLRKFLQEYVKEAIPT